MFTCVIITHFHFLLLLYNRKSEIESKRKQEEEERKKREEEEKRIQVNALAVCGFGGFFVTVVVLGLCVCFLVFLYLFINLFCSLCSPLSLKSSFYKYVSWSHHYCFTSKYKANVRFRASQDRSPISSLHATSSILSGGASVFKEF